MLESGLCVQDVPYSTSDSEYISNSAATRDLPGQWNDWLHRGTRDREDTRVRNVTLFLAAILASTLTQTLMAADRIKVDVIKNPYGGSRNTPELSTNPDYIHAVGLEGLIDTWGGKLVRPIQDVRLKPDQEREYGDWNRMALANANFADIVREGLQDKMIIIGLEANCNDLLGMFSGLKYDRKGNARKVGLVFYDSHGDFNVPETTLSGMLGGMPVAVAAGHSLHNLRKTTGLIDQTGGKK